MNRRRLFWRLYPIHLVLLVCSLLAVSVIMIQIFRAHTVKQRARILEDFAQLLADRLPAAGESSFAAEADRLCKAFGENSTLHFSVLLPTGEVVGDSQEDPSFADNDIGEPEVGRALSGIRSAVRRMEDGTEQKALFVVVPVIEEGELTSLVRVQMLLGPGTQLGGGSQVWLQIFWIALGTALLAGILSFLASRHISRPVEQMKRDAEKLASGDLNARLQIPAIEELASLAETLNDMAQRLHRMENNRREFVANVSHELKTPITSIKGFAETLIQRPSKNPENTQRFLGMIERDADRLSSIIDDLLLLSGIENQTKQGPELEPYPLQAVLESAVQACDANAREKNIQVKITGDPDISLTIHPRLLEQAFVNLLKNAVYYSEPHQAVEVGVHRTGSEVRIDVRDHGCGIAAEHLDQLFERFYRVDHSRSRKQGGTGLGLAIVRNITQAHHGKVTVISSPGEGSTFSIHLPRP